MHFVIWGGFSCSEITYVYDHELVSMSPEDFQEFQTLISELGDIVGVVVTYEPHKRRYCICCPVPVITSLPAPEENS